MRIGRLTQAIRLLLSAAAGLALVTVLVAAGGLLVLRASGRSLVSVQTGSMRPIFRPGDGLIIRPARPNQLQSGQIVSYHSLVDPAVVVTHRLVRIDHRSGWLITKGDRLADNDPAFPPRLLVGQATTVLPNYGVWAKRLRQPLVLAAAIYLPATWLAYRQLRLLQARWNAPHYQAPRYRKRYQVR